MLRATVKGGEIRLDSPYHPDFPQAARDLGGRFERDENQWVFSDRYRDEVEKLCWNRYGDTPFGPKKPVRIIANRKITAETQACYAFGHMLAQARSRDSGARPGPGVVLVDGQISSGGSTKYWETIIREGATFDLAGVSQEAIDEGQRNPTWQIEVLDPDLDPEKLRAERTMLEDRIKEIDAILAHHTEGQEQDQIA